MSTKELLTPRQAYEAMFAFLNLYSAKTSKPLINSLILSMLTDEQGRPVEESVARDWSKAVGTAKEGRVCTATNPPKSERAIDPARELRHMQFALNLNRSDRLETLYFNLCSYVTSKRTAQNILSVNMQPYKAALRACFEKALSEARAVRAKAVYFEYDMDNDWQSHLFVCPTYRKAGKRDDDWASPGTKPLKGPKMPAFCKFYLDTETFCATPQSAGITLLLIARTIGAVAEVAQMLDTKGLAIAAAYHDQDPVMRIKEQG